MSEVPLDGSSYDIQVLRALRITDVLRSFKIGLLEMAGFHFMIIKKRMKTPALCFFNIRKRTKNACLLLLISLALSSR